MGYRDDREALHGRIAKLEQELEDARREGEEKGRDEAGARAAVLEKNVREMRDALTRMERELRDLRGSEGSAGAEDTQKKRVVIALAVGGVTLIAGAAFAWVAMRRSPPSPVVEAPERPPVPETATPADPPPTPATPTATATPTADKATGVPRRAHALWITRVTRAEGITLAVGSMCRIAAELRTNDTAASLAQVSVVCGQQTLYDGKEQLSGISQTSSSVREILGPSDDKSTFTLRYQDLGMRTGPRAQVEIDTPARQVIAFRETIPRYRVELSVEPESLPGQALSGFDFRLRRAGKIASTTGAPPAKSGDACVLRAMPTGAGDECSAEIACGKAVLFPKTAPVTCTYERSRPLTVAGEGLSLDDASLKVTGKGFDATIALDPL